MVKILGKDTVKCPKCLVLLQFEPPDISYCVQASSHFISCPDCDTRIKVDEIAPDSWLLASRLILEDSETEEPEIGRIGS